MPHQCVRCNAFYEDGSSEILKGCKCGSRLFFFIKKEKLEEAQKKREEFESLSSQDKKKIEEDVYDIIGSDMEKDDSPVVLDFEAIRISKPGKFELDLVKLFDKKNPLVYRVGEGKYMIDIVETFNRKRGSDDEE